jgi:hypothetical protein
VVRAGVDRPRRRDLRGRAQARARAPERHREALRDADCEIEDMRMAILEADGNINVMKKPST